MSDKRSALDALSAAEKAAVLDELLAARPDLRQPAEACAAQLLTGADRSAVADDVEDALQGLDIEELNTRAGFGMRSAAVELAAGIMLGLYNCRHGNSETLLEYCPDYAAERASGVMSDCARLGIELPAAELLDLMPEWTAMLH